MMVVPFWRGWTEGIRAPIDYPYGTPIITLWNDGTGLRPVTDIDWAMWLAFRRIDDILKEAHARLDNLFAESQRI